jgi:hypothetical protein
MKKNKFLKEFIINTIIYSAIVISLIAIHHNKDNNKKVQSKVKFVYQQF